MARFVLTAKGIFFIIALIFISPNTDEQCVENTMLPIIAGPSSKVIAYSPQLSPETNTYLYQWVIKVSKSALPS